MKIEGTSAVVTGGGSGIGKAIALALALRKVNVAIADFELDAAQQTLKEIETQGGRGIALGVDVTSPENVKQLADKTYSEFGTVSLLFNNAGILPGKTKLFEQCAEEARWTLSVNIEGVINGVREFTPRFIEAGAPAYVINTCSEQSYGVQQSVAGLYTGTTQAILGISEVLQREVPDHISVSVLCPGLIRSAPSCSEERLAQTTDDIQLKPLSSKFRECRGTPADKAAQCILRGIESNTFLIL